MGRPSVKEERQKEILDAFEICVTRYGVEGATLERIAEISGLKRPLIRHHAGNRQDLVTALFDRFLEKSEQDLSRHVEDLPPENTTSAFLDRMFHGSSDQNLVLLAESFIACSATDPKIASAMTQWVRNFVRGISDTIKIDFPKASESDLRAVSYGIMGIYFNFASLASFLNLDEMAEDSKKAALRLVETLHPPA